MEKINWLEYLFEWVRAIESTTGAKPRICLTETEISIEMDGGNSYRFEWSLSVDSLQFVMGQQLIKDLPGVGAKILTDLGDSFGTIAKYLSAKGFFSSAEKDQKRSFCIDQDGVHVASLSWSWGFIDGGYSFDDVRVATELKILFESQQKQHQRLASETNPSGTLVIGKREKAREVAQFPEDFEGMCPDKKCHLRKVVDIGTQIGKGGFGEVFEGKLRIEIAGRVPVGTRVAVKQMEVPNIHAVNQYEVFFENLATEILALERAMREGCANIMQIYDVYFQPMADAPSLFFVICEFINGQNLNQIVEKDNKFFANMPESSFVDKYIRPLVAGLTCLHNNRIAHCDIKPENVMFDSDANTVKWIDFGLSCVQVCLGKIQGNLEATPPEIWLQEVSLVDVESWIRADIWGFGTCIYRLLTANAYPFQYQLWDARNSHAQMKRLSQSYRVQYPPLLGDKPILKALFDNTLAADPSARSFYPIIV